MTRSNRPSSRLPRLPIEIAGRLGGAIVVSLLFASIVEASEWSKFRGPNDQGGGTSSLPAESYGLTVEWDQALGSGYSQVAVANGKLLTEFISGDTNVVAAFDAGSGQEIWRYSLSSVPTGDGGSGDGPLATPTVVEGVVYAVGPRGQVVALEIEAAQVLWSFELNAKNSTLPDFGYTSSPVVVGDLVIVGTGGEGHAITALDRATGELKWAVGSDEVTYQTPSFVEVAGKDVLVAVTQQKLFGVDVEVGRIVWETRHSEGALAQASHVVLAGQGRFLVNYRNGARLYQASPTGVKVVWESRGFANSLAIPVRVGNYFYGFTGKVLSCVEVSSGEIVWRSRETSGRGISLVGDTLAILNFEGELVLVNASPDGYQELTRLKALDKNDTHFPSFGMGRFFLRNMDRLVSVKVDTALTPTPGKAPGLLDFMKPNE